MSADTASVEALVAEPPSCDHEWEFQDESFDHEFGTEIIQYWQCALCDITTDRCPYDIEP